mgnify:CR=1 FL=1
MFRRHYARLISIILMVVVSVGLTSGIGMATDKIDHSISDFHAQQNMSDLILMNTEGAFTEDDLALLQERYGAENVLRGGFLEFEVSDGTAVVNDTELTLTGVPDGIVRVYIYDCDDPADVGINEFGEITRFDADHTEGAIAVYTERGTTQFPEKTQTERYTLSATMTEHLTEYEYSGMTLEADLDVTIPLSQEYYLAGTVYNPQHMAVRDDVSFTEVEGEEDEYEPLSAIYYVFGDLVDVTVEASVKGIVTVPIPGMDPQQIDTTQEEHVQIAATELLNQIYITLPEEDSLLFSAGYNADVDAEASAMETLFADRYADGTIETLTMEENYSFRSFHEYSGKIMGIGIVLMVVFLFVTVLVVLSTVTRLLDEERSQIACLMTQGYSHARIIAKYLLFAFIGTAIGGVGAYFAGLGVSRMIYVNFEWEYVLPACSSNIAIGFFIGTFALILLSTLIATAVAGHKLTCQQPADLLRPKVPKRGKKVFLERIPLIWNRLSFKYKSTMRNVLRFFGRFLMTVVSVACSTALVLAGFAILDCCLFQDIGGTAMIGISIIVLAFAALLNFVVTYTLTNINISERERELATLMVLGYQDNEVAGYIYREIYITSGIGILFGLPLGALVCQFIFVVMGFGSVPGISWFVWILAPVLSIIFTVLVTLMLRHKIVRIDMNESLKAIE